MDRSGPGPPTRREDSWSDAATGALIEAWGDRYLCHNRGILRLKDWKEIADAVNAVADGAAAEADKPARIWSDAQCKNRVDTLKKKYKLERSKPSPSPWPFFHRLEILIGEGSAAAGDGGGGGGGGVKKKKRSKPVASAKPTPVAIAIAPESPPEESIGGDGDVDGDGDEEGDGDVAARGLARALVRLGEVYERVERSKQRAVMELERQRMEFSKEIEFQRLNMFLEAQVEMAKSKNKRSKPGGHGSASGKK